MSMEVLDRGLVGKEEAKPMYEMKDGEVCKIVESGRAVIKVARGRNCVYLVLENHGSAITYGDTCSLYVRPLKVGEFIDVRFS